MKLLEIAKGLSTADLHRVQRRGKSLHDVITYSLEYERSPSLTQSIDLLMKDEDLLYEGPMFRAVVMEAKTFFQMPDIRPVFTYIQQYMHKEPDQHYAWSADLQGMQTAIGINADNEVYGDIEGWNICPVLRQTGRGVDVVEVFKAAGNKWGLEDEEEVFARYNSSVELYGFLWGIREAGTPNQKFYHVKDYRDMLDYAKKEVDRHQGLDDYMRGKI